MKAVILNRDLSLGEKPRKKGERICYVEDDVQLTELRACLDNLHYCEVVDVVDSPKSAAKAERTESRK